MTPSRRAQSRARGFLLGASYVWRGFRAWGVNPRLMGLGLIPGAVVFLVVGSALVTLAVNVADISRWVLHTVGIEHTGMWGSVLVWLVGATLLGGAALIAIYTFTALTLLVGQPFFERISQEVDTLLGAPALGEGEKWWRSAVRGIGEAMRVLALTMLIAVALFFVSLIPVAGTVTSFCIGAVCGGWFLALELTAFPLGRRGAVSLAQRRRALASQRAVSVGFGVTVFLLFLIPFVAVVAMPAATVGATLLTRRLDDASVGSTSSEAGPLLGLPRAP